MALRRFDVISAPNFHASYVCLLQFLLKPASSQAVSVRWSPAIHTKESVLPVTQAPQAIRACEGPRKWQLAVHFLERMQRQAVMILVHNPDPWADPKTRSPVRFCNLRPRSVSIQNWGFLGSSQGPGSVALSWGVGLHSDSPRGDLFWSSGFGVSSSF